MRNGRYPLAARLCTTGRTCATLGPMAGVANDDELAAQDVCRSVNVNPSLLAIQACMLSLASRFWKIQSIINEDRLKLNKIVLFYFNLLLKAEYVHLFYAY